MISTGTQADIISIIILQESTKDKSSPGGEDSLTSQFAKSWLQQSLDWKLNPRAQNHYTISCKIILNEAFELIMLRLFLQTAELTVDA